MDKYDFVPPAPTMFTLADHEGHAAIFTPTTYLTDITTKFGVRDAIVLDVVCLDCGEEFHDVRMFQSRIIGTLKQLMGRKVLARIAQGTPTRPGQQPPWTLIDATRDVAVVKAATVWLDSRLDDPHHAPTHSVSEQATAVAPPTPVTQSPSVSSASTRATPSPNGANGVTNPFTDTAPF